MAFFTECAEVPLREMPTKITDVPARPVRVWSDQERVRITKPREMARQRIKQHRADLKNYLAGKQNKMSSYAIVQHASAKIILLEKFACASKGPTPRLPT